jgi:hypothetical protein
MGTLDNKNKYCHGVHEMLAHNRALLTFCLTSACTMTAYAQDTGETFALNVTSDGPDEDYFEMGLGLPAVFANNIQTFVDYRTTVELEDVSADLFTIGIRGTF